MARWFFISCHVSKSADGLLCVACVLFAMSAHQRSRGKNLYNTTISQLDECKGKFKILFSPCITQRFHGLISPFHKVQHWLSTRIDNISITLDVKESLWEFMEILSICIVKFIAAQIIFKELVMLISGYGKNVRQFVLFKQWKVSWNIIAFCWNYFWFD